MDLPNMYYVTGKNILDLDDKDIAVVIPVTVSGDISEGLLKQLTIKYPDMIHNYKSYCADGSLRLGHCVMEENSHGKFIFFPIKRDFKTICKIEYIQDSLDSLCKALNRFPDLNIALPPIACGVNELTYQQVLPRIYYSLQQYRNKIYLIGW